MNHDAKVEADELFNVALGAISGLAQRVDPADVSTAGSPQTGTILNDDTATLTLAGVSASQPEGTGGTTTDFTFSATLDNPVQDGFTVAITVNDDTAATADGDYVHNDQSMTFVGTAGESYPITVSVNHDAKVEADELFNVALGAISGLAQRVDPADVSTAGSPQTGTILNDDTATLTLAGVSASQPEGTGGTTTDFTFDVTLDNDVQDGLTVAITVNDDTATTADGDYVDNDGSVPFMGTANESQTITVQVPHDAKVEADELFTVALGALSGIDPTAADDVSIAGGPQIGTIVNDDTATLTLAGVAASQPEGTGGTTTDFTFSATLDNPVQGGLTVALTVNDDTATIGDGDYVDNDGSLTFVGTANESQPITVSVNHDAKVEADELFNVALGAISGLATGVDSGDISTAGSPQTATIVNDDTATVTLSGVSASQPEGTGGTTTDFTFSATLDNPVQGGFTVAITVNDDTATTGDGDYVDNDQSMTFVGTAGENYPITVSVNHDAKVEADELFNVALGAISGLAQGVDPADVSTVGSPSTGTVINDDTATLTLAGVSATQDEGTGGTSTPFTFSATLDNPVQDGFTVAITVNDDTAATADGDYVHNDQSMTFVGTAGESYPITVSVNHDAKVEADELFNVALGAISGLAQGVDPADVGTAGTPATGTVINDDTATLTLAGVSATQDEGTGGTSTSFEFSVTLDNDVQDGLTVAYTTNDGTALVGDSDYVDNDGSLPFAGTANETQTITVAVTHDARVELDELFTVALGALSGLATGVDPADISTVGSPQTGTVVNDEQGQISITDVTQVETDSGTTDFVFDVTLSHEVDVTVLVDYQTVDDTARVGDSDYQAGSGTLTFSATAPGETQNAAVVLNGDEKVELDETFLLNLSNIQASGRDVTFTGLEKVPAPATLSGTGTILNDDTGYLAINDVSVTEGDPPDLTEATFTVSLSNAVDVPVTVDFSTADGTALVSDNDYQSGSGVLEFRGLVPSAQFVDSGQELWGGYGFGGPGPGMGSGVALGDLDGDGDRDAVIGDEGGASVWRNDGSATFRRWQAPFCYWGASGVALGDLDGDGDLDAMLTSLYATQVFRNEGDGLLTEQQSHGMFGLDVALGDLNGDGDLDAVVGRYDGWTALENRGHGLFSILQEELGEYTVSGVSLGNLNGDSALDLFITGTSASQVWLNDGLGGFTDSTQSLGSATSYGVALGDLDGNGTLDVVVSNVEAPGKVWLNELTGELPYAGETQTFTVTLIGDDTFDLDELFYANLSNIQAQQRDVVFEDSQGECTIENDDLNLVVSPPDVVVVEGGSNTFTVSLSQAPRQELDVLITPTDDGGPVKHGPDPDLTAWPPRLTFTAEDWDMAQTVTLLAAEDVDLCHGTAWFELSAADIDTVMVLASEHDNDVLSVVVDPPALSVPEGGTAFFTVALEYQPCDDVTVAVTLSSASDSDISVDPAELVFSAVDWFVPQTVTVTAGEDDDVCGGAATVSVSAGAGAGENVLVWTPAGVPVATAPEAELPYATVSDGAGGVFAAWQHRLPPGKHAAPGIYVQRLDGSGVAQWPAGGVSLCSAGGDQDYPLMVADGAGGVLVVYYDASAERLSAQRLSGDGELLWGDCGVPVTSVPGGLYSSGYVLASDGAGGAIVAWLPEVAPKGKQFSMLYGQRLDAAGAPLWGDSGVPLATTPSYRYELSILGDGAGGATLVWQEGLIDKENGLDSHVYAQRVDATGAALWAEDGLLVSTTPGGYGWWMMDLGTGLVSDGAGGIIVVWTSQETPVKGAKDEYPQVYAQRLNAAGGQPWGAAGVSVFPAALGGSVEPRVVADRSVRSATDGAWGAVIAAVRPDATWETTGIYAQRLDPSGALGWGDTGSLLSPAAGSYDWPALVSDEAGGAVVTWHDWTYWTKDSRRRLFSRDKDLGESHLYAQHVDGAGVAQWSPAGARVSPVSDYQEMWPAAIATDGAGGAILTWLDLRNAVREDGYENADVYAQRLAVAGRATVAVTESEDDVLELLVTPTELPVPEDGEATFSVVLSAKPCAARTVVVAHVSGDDDLVPSPVLFAFDPDTWDQSQLVTVSAQEDGDTCNSTAVLRVFSPGLAPVDVHVSEVDDDVQQFLVTPQAVTVPEGSHELVLVDFTYEPCEPVTLELLNLSGDADLQPTPATLTFTSSNWSLTRTVTILADPDDDVCSDEAQISIAAIGVDEPALSPVLVTATEQDDDTQGLLVSETSLTVPEGGDATFTVALARVPCGDLLVTVQRASGDPGLAVTSPSPLLFTPETYATEQVVTIAANEDGDIEDDSAIFEVTAPDTPAATLTATEADNEPKEFTVYLPASATEGDGVLVGAGSVVMPGTLHNDFSVSLVSDDPGEAAVPDPVVIPAGELGVSFDVTIVDDTVVDGPMTATVTASAPDWTDGSATLEVLDNDGTLCVTIAPDAALQCDAHWSVDGAIWYHSGECLVLPAGEHTVQYSDVFCCPGTPPDETETVAVGQTTDVTGTYGCEQELEITDSVDPADDLQVPFLPCLAPGDAQTETVTVHNVGQNVLTVTDVYLGTDPWYTEDFEDGLAQGWDEDLDRKWYVEDGTYVAEDRGGATNSLVATYAGARWADFSYEVRFKREPGVCFLARITDDYDYYPARGSGYALIVDVDRFTVVRWLDGARTHLTPSLYVMTPFLNPPEDWNTVTLNLWGASLSFYINGNLVWAGEDNHVSSGRIGLQAFYRGQPERMYFDDVLVGPPMRWLPSKLSPEQEWYSVHAALGEEPVPPYPGPATPAAKHDRLLAHALAAANHAFDLSGLPALPHALNPGESFTFDVFFEPTTVGAYQDLLIIESNDLDESHQQMLLTGCAEVPLEPDLWLEPKKLKFRAEVGMCKTKLLTIGNDGEGTLAITSVESTNDHFSVVSPTFPTTVAPGGTLDVEVQFCPTNKRKQKGKLKITSNDPDRPLVKVRLRGKGQ